MNITAKINSKALSNILIIGEALLHEVSEMREYTFEKANGLVADMPPEYAVYHVRSMERWNTPVPFKKTA
jgi:hypothetical protein